MAASSVRRRNKVKAFSLITVLPNIITLLALCSGMTAIRFALMEQWKYALGAIFLSAVLDVLDGRLARLLKTSSSFGAELDSFSDFLSFGLAPSLIIYLKSLQQLDELGWVIALFYSLCLVLRLARFNVMNIYNTDALKTDSFIGVPAPMAGLICLLPLITFHAFPNNIILVSPIMCVGFMLTAGGLAVSRIPTFSLKKIIIPPVYVLPFILITFLMLGLLYSYPWMTLSLMGFGYLALIPFYYYYYARHAKQLLEQPENKSSQIPSE